MRVNVNELRLTPRLWKRGEATEGTRKGLAVFMRMGIVSLWLVRSTLFKKGPCSHFLLSSPVGEETAEEVTGHGPDPERRVDGVQFPAFATHPFVLREKREKKRQGNKLKTRKWSYVWKRKCVVNSLADNSAGIEIGNWHLTSHIGHFWKIF